MCVIIDACVRDAVFTAEPRVEAQQVIDWIEREQGRVAYGGTKLCTELFKSSRARRQLRAWKQAGLALQYKDVVVDSEQNQVDKLGIAKSDDTHILALARVSGARTLYSDDEPLHNDFKNSELLSNPRGRVYQLISHRDLLEHTSSCRAARSRGEFVID